MKNAIQSGEILRLAQTDTSLNQLEELLSEASKKGYEFVTVASLLENYTNYKTGSAVYSGAQ